MKRFFYIVSIPFILSGCMTAEDYAGAQEALKGSPALRQQSIEKCMKGSYFSPPMKRELAVTMKVPNDGKLMQTFCTRLVAGMASGRLAYDDLYSARAELSPKVVRALQQR